MQVRNLFLHAVLAALPLGGCVTTGASRGGAAFEATLADELEPVYPDQAAPALPDGEPFRLDAARGSFAGVHVMLQGLPEGVPLDVRLNCPEEARLGEPAFFRLLDVPVEINTGISSRTEKWDDKENPYVVRRAPFRVYDARRPLEQAESVDCSTVALAAEVPVPRDARPGRYDLRIEVKAGDEGVSLPLVLVVYDAVVPPIGKDTLAYTNWYSTKHMVTDESIEMWSEEFWPILDRYIAMMARGRQNTARIPLCLDQTKDGSITMDRERVKRLIDAFTRHGFYYLEGSHLCPEVDGRLVSPFGRHPVRSPEGEAEMVEILETLSAFIQAEGLIGRWVQHIKDEPGGHLAEDYRHVGMLIHRRLPGVPVLDAMTGTHAGFTKGLDIWCPTVDVYERNRRFFEEREAEGDTVWVYVCLTPTGPWLNRLIDQERLRQVYIGWGAARYGTQGFLHWALNRHIVDPLEQSVVDHPQAPNTNNQLPAGDTHILYPGENAPWSSTRFEAHRIGMEDRELLLHLKAKAPMLFEQVVASVFRGYDDYERHVPAYRFARRRLLEALSE